MKLEHVAIAVEDLDKASALYRESFGLVETHREEVPAQKVRVAFLKDPSGDSCTLELISPTGEGGVAKFLASRGPGLHHLAFRAPDIGAEMERLRSAGKPPLDAAPRPGAHGHSVCFLHPKNAAGVLVELVGEPRP